MDLQPTLTGRHITLRPMQLEDAPLLWRATGGAAAEIFRWYAHPMTTEEKLRSWVETGLDERCRGVSAPFVTITASGNVAGGTRFMNIDPAHRKTEIGNTWLGTRSQRTAANTEAKYLMLRHAFEVWKLVRVEFKTDALNQRSRDAILRIGAKQEGIFRAHMVCEDGRLRDSVYFSVIAAEWLDVKQRLEHMLAR